MKATKMIIRLQYEDGPSFQAERLTLRQVLWFDQNGNHLTKSLFDATDKEIKDARSNARKDGMWMQDQQQNDVSGGMIASEVWKI